MQTSPIEAYLESRPGRGPVWAGREFIRGRVRIDRARERRALPSSGGAPDVCTSTRRRRRRRRQGEFRAAPIRSKVNRKNLSPAHSFSRAVTTLERIHRDSNWSLRARLCATCVSLRAPRRTLTIPSVRLESATTCCLLRRDANRALLRSRPDLIAGDVTLPRALLRRAFEVRTPRRSTEAHHLARAWPCRAAEAPARTMRGHTGQPT